VGPAKEKEQLPNFIEDYGTWSRLERSCINKPQEIQMSDVKEQNSTHPEYGHQTSVVDMYQIVSAWKTTVEHAEQFSSDN